MNDSAPERSSADVSVLLVESHALVLTALRTLLAATPGLSVAGVARDLEVAVTVARAARPDVVLMGQGVLADVEALDSLRREAPRACMIVLSDGASEDASEDPGIAACRLASECGIRELCATLASLLGPRCATCLLRPQCRTITAPAVLTRRERDVAIHVASGLTSKQIAARLGIKTRTVNTYRESLARKLGGSSAAVITRFVLEAGAG